MLISFIYFIIIKSDIKHQYGTSTKIEYHKNCITYIYIYNIYIYTFTIIMAMITSENKLSLRWHNNQSSCCCVYDDIQFNLNCIHWFEFFYVQSFILDCILCFLVSSFSFYYKFFVCVFEIHHYTITLWFWSLINYN